MWLLFSWRLGRDISSGGVHDDGKDSFGAFETRFA